MASDVMARVAELQALIGEPTMQPPQVDWIALEERLGTPLPSDHHLLAEQYATLQFDGFLGWFHPGEAAADVQADGMLSTLVGPIGFDEEDGAAELVDDDGRGVEVPVFPRYPAAGGALAWGATENGDICVWLTDGEPDEWTVAVYCKGQMWRYDGGLVDFLIAILTKTIRCPLFPASFPGACAWTSSPLSPRNRPRRPPTGGAATETGTCRT